MRQRGLRGNYCRKERVKGKLLQEGEVKGKYRYSLSGRVNTVDLGEGGRDG